MTGRDDHLVLNGAASQADRLRGAPEPARAQVDGRSLADLLKFAAEYGALVRFYDLHDQPDGDWSSFFLADRSVRLALCATLDLADIETTFDKLLAAMLAAGDFETRLERVRVAITVVLRLVRLLDEEQHDPRSLDDALARLGATDHGHHITQPARQLAMHLGGRSIETAMRHDVEAYAGDWFRTFVAYLGKVVTALITGLERQQPEAARALETSLLGGDHAPQSGLYDAFAVLFGHAQDTANRFSARFAEFYRAEVLKQTSRLGSADRLSLAFMPAKGVSTVSLPRGTSFTAGEDASGQTIAYALDNALDVNSADLAALGTLTVTRSPAPGPRLPAQVFTSVAALSPTAPRIATPFPIFGATSAGQNGILATNLASLGFAVVSQTLLMAGGARTVSLGFTFTSASLTAALAAIGTLGAPEGDRPQALADLLQAAFALRYSTNGGWIAIDGYTVTPPDADDGAYVLSFSLDANAAPVAPLSALPPDPAAAPLPDGAAVPDADTPTLVADLVQAPTQVTTGSAAVTIYPYAILSGLALSALSLDVDVSGLRDLVVSNTGAKVEIGRPFSVFGSPPTWNSTLDVTAPELFAKTLSSFSLDLDWFNLPIDQQGFYNYYLAYVIGPNGERRKPGELFDNALFTGELKVNNPGLWTLAANSQQLFRTAPPPDGSADAPNPDPRGTLVPAVSMTATVGEAAPPAYYDPATSSVQLSLTNPDYAFGATLYAANVMEASVQLTAAASACAQQCGDRSTESDATAHLTSVATAIQDAPDDRLQTSLKSAVSQAVSGLDGDALSEITDAINAVGDAAAQASLNASLSTAVASAKGSASSLIQRLTVWRSSPPDYENVHAAVKSWLAANAATLAAANPAAVANAQALLAAGDGLGDMLKQVAPLAPAAARPVAAQWQKQIEGKLGAALGANADDCVSKCMDQAGLLGLPNTPWLPMASNLTVDYTAATALPAQNEARFYWLEPFDHFALTSWTKDGLAAPVSLLAPIESDGGLYIQLSEPTDSLSLLFQMAPPAAGWPNDTPQVTWSAQAADGSWTQVAPLRDETHNLRNPGIVNLALDTEAQWLRVATPSDAAGFPALAGLLPNAATATWTGPGGADALGTPLPAGSVTKPAEANSALGSILQPEPSTGGRPMLDGRAFDIWLAERLRHKDRGIDGWDYARLTLAEFPSLWQVAVTPASKGDLTPAPGCVWVVAVPGPNTAGVGDPTEPTNDAALLETIQQYLAARISPFIQLSVTNPPYQRLTVAADVIFTETDALEANKTRLNNELISFLSPWPTKAPRPDDYYTRRQVAHFIRHRPYVRGIRSLELIHERSEAAPNWRYLTSAQSHRITGASEGRAQQRLATVEAAWSEDGQA